MLVNALKKAVAYIKEIQDVGLFMTMSNSRWYASFSGSPLFYVMFPFIGILFAVSALINGYQFSKAYNKNFDKLFDLIVTAVCAVFASISLVGAVVATSTGTVFVAGPWLFLASALLALGSQLFMAGLQGYRAFESVKYSAQRMHYIQAALSHLFNSALLAAVVGCITFVILTPVAPLFGAACAGVATALSVSSIMWRVLPTNLKTLIKNSLGFARLSSQEQLIEQPDSLHLDKRPLQTESLPLVNYSRFFSHIDYASAIHGHSYENEREYVLELIDDKIERLSKLPASAKTMQKIQFLTQIDASIKQGTYISKNDSLATYPLAFQSFWSDKGEIEHIFDAAFKLQQRYSSIIAVEEQWPTP